MFHHKMSPEEAASKLCSNIFFLCLFSFLFIFVNSGTLTIIFLFIVVSYEDLKEQSFAYGQTLWPYPNGEELRLASKDVRLLFSFDIVYPGYHPAEEYPASH